MTTKTAFLTTIYPIDNSFVDNFFSSLLSQTDKYFDVIIVNDGFLEIESFKEKFGSLNIVEIEPADSVAKNRELLIRYAIDHQYNIAVFGDIDDYFESNRVQISKSLLTTNDIVINDLTVVREGIVVCENILSSRLKNLTKVPLDFILDKNIFGLSNTAIRLDGLLSQDIIFPPDLVAVDWYFYSQLLLLCKCAVFTNDTITYYRQHDSNTVGIGVLNEQSVVHSINVKLLHYRYMAQKSEQFKPLLDQTQKISKWISSKKRLNEFVYDNIKRLENPLWWETIEFGE